MGAAPCVGSGGRGRGFDKSDGRDIRRAGTRWVCAESIEAVEDVAVAHDWARDEDEGVKYATDAGRGPVPFGSAALLLLLLRCRIARAGEGGVGGARRGDEEFLGGGVGGHVVHVGLGGEG